MGGSCTRHPLCCRPFPTAPPLPPHTVSQKPGDPSLLRGQVTGRMKMPFGFSSALGALSDKSHSCLGEGGDAGEQFEDVLG